MADEELQVPESHVHVLVDHPGTSAPGVRASLHLDLTRLQAERNSTQERPTDAAVLGITNPKKVRYVVRR